MTQDSIKAFVRENFGKDYFPVYHGQRLRLKQVARFGHKVVGKRYK